MPPGGSAAASAPSSHCSKRRRISSRFMSLFSQHGQPWLRSEELPQPWAARDERRERSFGIDRKEQVARTLACVTEHLVGVTNPFELLGRSIRRVFLHLPQIGCPDVFFGGRRRHAQYFSRIHYLRLPFFRLFLGNPLPVRRDRNWSRDSPRRTALRVSSNSILATSGGMSDGISNWSRRSSSSSSESSNGSASPARAASTAQADCGGTLLAARARLQHSTSSVSETAVPCTP